MRGTRRLLVSLIFGISTAVILQATDRIAADEKCRTFLFGEKSQPGWSVSGDWISPDELVLVDALNNRLLRYTAQGRFLGVQSDSLELKVRSSFEEEKFLPSAISSADHRAWLQLPIGKFAKLDKTGAMQEAVDLWGLQLDGRPQDGRLVAILRWTAAGENGIFGFGNFRMEDGSLRTGFFRVNLGARPEGIIIESWPETHPIQLWYRMGFAYVTATSDGAGYGLVIGSDRRIRVVRNKPGEASLRTIDALPRELKWAPELPEFMTPEDFIDLMAKVESSTIPVGLFSWGSQGDRSLFVLWRQNTKGQQKWLLSKIDTSRGQPMGTAELPAQSNHLMVIPGPHHWALVQKGPVAGFGIQSIPRVTYVPATKIRDFAPGITICK